MNMDDTANQVAVEDTDSSTLDTDTGAEAETQATDEPELDEDGNPIEKTEPEDDFEEVERDGKTAKIPAWLKPELMMQADYTRKTQELAAARQAFEAERQQLQQADASEMQARAQIAAIDAQLTNFAKVDWNAWSANDPFAANDAFRQYQLLKDAKAQVHGYLGELTDARTQAQQQEAAKRMEAGAAELARDIPNWSPDTAAKLMDFGQKHYGFSRQDLDGIDDPRLVKVLHAAFQWEESQKKQRAAKQVTAAQAVQPAANVAKASSPPKGLDDRLSAEEWMRRREEQLRKKNAR